MQSLWESVYLLRRELGRRTGREVALPEACWLAGRIAVLASHLSCADVQSAVSDAERVFAAALQGRSIPPHVFHMARLFLRPMVTQALAAASVT